MLLTLSGIKVSPKGDLIAFLNSPFAQDGGGYVTIVDSEGKHVASSRKWNLMQGLAWQPDGSEIWFTAGQRLES